MNVSGAAVSKECPTPLVELQDVTIELGGRTVLRDVSAQIGPSEFVGLIGPNGSGKSTLLRAILGLIQPASGQILFEGQPVRRGNRRIGYSPQIRTYDRELPITGRDFVGLGIDGDRWGIGLPNRRRQERIDEILQAVGARSYADKAIGQLSGGEQQRLSIAQAMVAEPSLLLLDEPLASLDLRSQGDIVGLVDELRHEHNVAVLFVTHGVNPLLEVMDRVWYVAGGRSEIGPVHDVIQSEVLSRLYGSPVDVIEVGGRVFVSTSEEYHHKHGSHTH